MPLEKSPSKAAIGRNIKREEEAGKPHGQAVAIALDTAREAGADIPRKGATADDDFSRDVADRMLGPGGGDATYGPRKAGRGDASPEYGIPVPPPPLAASPAQVTKVDTGKCLVEAIICTDCVDNLGDIVEPAGVDLSIHEKNNVVYYHHGIGIGGPESPGYILPVGKAEDEHGRYGVRLMENVLVGTTRFSQTTKFARDVFALYAEEILRGFSVNALPLAWSRIADKVSPGGAAKRCFRFTSWLLKEYSATGLPVNPEALTVAVQKAWIAGEPMDPILRASLVPFCLPGRTWSPGVVLPPTTARTAAGKLTTVSGVPAEKAMSIRRGLGKTALGGGAGAAVGGALGGPAGAVAGGAAGAALASDDDKKAEENDDERMEPGDTHDDVLEDEKKDEGDEGEKKAEDLRPGERGMIDAHQTIRDHRLANARRQYDTDDPEAISAHEAIDDHLAKAEEIAGDYMERRGHKRPDPVDYEGVKSMCRAGGLNLISNPKPGQSLTSQAVGGTVGEMNREEVYYKGIAYRGTRFMSILRAAEQKKAQPADELTPLEIRILTRELKMERERLQRARKKQ